MTTRRQQSTLDFLSQLQSCLTKVEFGEVLPLYIATLQTPLRTYPRGSTSSKSFCDFLLRHRPPPSPRRFLPAPFQLFVLLCSRVPRTQRHSIMTSNVTTA